MAVERRARSVWTGTPPERLEVTATATFQAGEGVESMHLEVVGQVPGVDEEAFKNAAEDAKNNCPISKAVVGIPEITLAATLG